VAGDLLAQAEHDEMATPILLTPSEALVRRVLREVERQVRTLPRREVARQALEANGVAVVVASLEEAVDLANHFAPEHLCLAVQDPWRLLPRVRNAGGVFIGEHTPESVGDYLAGPSHAMPTGGTARWASALGVHHFLKPVPVVALGPRGLEDLALSTMRIARAEGLEGHARAVAMRRARRGGRDGRAH
jgi:histidinol dehydrogenase